QCSTAISTSSSPRGPRSTASKTIGCFAASATHARSEEPGARRGCFDLLTGSRVNVVLIDKVSSQFSGLSFIQVRSLSIGGCLSSCRFELAVAKRFERHAKFFREKLRLFPGREVAAFVDLIEIDEIGIRLLRPAARGRVDFVRKNAHGDRDGDISRIEKASLV